MYILRTAYNVMEGEPQLGTMIEEELFCEVEEVVQIVCEYIEANHAIPEEVYGIDCYSEEEILIVVDEWL